MKRLISTRLALCTALVLSMVPVMAIADTASLNSRWYSATQIKSGAEIFKMHCLVCHGEAATSVSRWDKMDKHGKFPPPPLNGTAHAWHHPLPLLRRTIREGGIKLGGSMPAFKDTLSAEEIDSVIAWFQSLWSDEIYARWSGQWRSADPSEKTPWSLKALLKP